MQYISAAISFGRTQQPHQQADYLSAYEVFATSWVTLTDLMVRNKPPI